jgi:hypothetical protein
MDDVNETDKKPVPVHEPDPYREDCSEEVAKLPLIVFDPGNHFVKDPTYKQEIRHLLERKGCPYITFPTLMMTVLTSKTRCPFSPMIQ